MSSRALGCVLACGALVAAASAQEPEQVRGYQEVTAEQFMELPPSLPSGERFSISYLKFNRLAVDRYLKVMGSRLGEETLLVVDDGLRQKLNANRDSEGQRLTPHRTNIQVLGTGRRLPGGQYVLEVTRVVRLESDSGRFGRLAGALEPGDARARLRLAHRIRTEVYPHQEDAAERRDLAQLVRRLEGEARQLEREGLEPLPGGAEAWIRYGVRFRDLEALAEVWAAEGIAPEVKREASQALREKLDARLYLGRWLPFDEFKRAVGFVSIEGRWVRRERVEFLRAVEEERRRQGRGGVISELTGGLLTQAMLNGEIVKGMTKDHVLGTVRRGPQGREIPSLPVYVDRIREEVQGTALVWEQWIMADGLRIYFYGPLVFDKHEPEGK